MRLLSFSAAPPEKQGVRAWGGIVRAFALGWAVCSIARVDGILAGVCVCVGGGVSLEVMAPLLADILAKERERGSVQGGRGAKREGWRVTETERDGGRDRE